MQSLTNSFNSGTQDICVRHFRIGPLQTASWAVLEWGETIAKKQELMWSSSVICEGSPQIMGPPMMAEGPASWGGPHDLGGPFTNELAS